MNDLEFFLNLWPIYLLLIKVYQIWMNFNIDCNSFTNIDTNWPLLFIYKGYKIRNQYITKK